jgi:hypothetical protein
MPWETEVSPDKNVFLYKQSDYISLCTEHVQECFPQTEMLYTAFAAHKKGIHNEKIASIYPFTIPCILPLKLLMHFSVIWYWVLAEFDFGSWQCNKTSTLHVPQIKIFP